MWWIKHMENDIVCFCLKENVSNRKSSRYKSLKIFYRLYRNNDKRLGVSYTLCKKTDWVTVDFLTERSGHWPKSIHHNSTCVRRPDESSASKSPLWEIIHEHNMPTETDTPYTCCLSLSSLLQNTFIIFEHMAINLRSRVWDFIASFQIHYTHCGFNGRWDLYEAAILFALCFYCYITACMC